MKNLILALNRANLSPDGIETILTELEVWIDSKVSLREQKLMIETITPIQRETDGIRNEIRFLAETMKQGFERSEEKLDFTRKQLEMQIAANRESMELQIASNRESLEKQIAANRVSLESQIEATRKNLEVQFTSTRERLELHIKKPEIQIISTRENLETQIKAIDRQLALLQKILWIVLTLVLGLFAKAIHLI